MWQQLLIVFGGNATLLIVLGFLFKSLISQLLTKDVEKFKTELKADADKSIEQFKTTLQMTALEHEVRFSKLHEKRAQVIADLYERFVKAYWDTDTYHKGWEFAGGQTYEEQGRSASQSLNEAYRLFEINRIYLSDPLAGELDTFFERANALTYNVRYFETLSDKNKTAPHIVQSHADARKEGLEAFQKEFPAMRQSLDLAFKRLLKPKDSTD